MKVIVTVQLRTDQWKTLESREVSAECMSGKELEGLAYSLGDLTQATLTGIAKRLLAAEAMEGVPVEVVEVE